MKILIPLAVAALVIIISFFLFGELETISIELLTQLKNNPLQYAFLSFIILVSDIFLPVPSSIVMYLNGVFLGITGGFTVSLISVNVFSTVGYFVGKYSSIALKSKPDARSEKILKEYGHFAIIITRGIPVLSESICFVCGYNLYNFKKYLLLNFIGYIPVCLIYAYFGSAAENQNLFFISLGSSLLVSFLLWMVGKKLIGRSEQIKNLPF
ncbi:MAG TPA: VTT domain-containing protein [Pyrinomonadaceae bacterium]|nr:VTT domain-containing protein [Pyrinomonadaceae bacterium]